MTRIFTMLSKRSIELVLKLHDLRIENQKATINNKIRAIEQKFVLDPVK